jgi:acetolactate synthase-1/2/3 large subunit
MIMPKASEIFADILVDAGIDHVFGMPGGATMFVFDALHDKREQIRTILARQEGSASCMADIYGRLTGKPAVVMGQGAWIGSNAAFGIMEAYMAGSPMVIIGDLSDWAGITQHGVYQGASGEYGAINLPNIMRSITKYTTIANSPSEFAHGVQLAIKHATTGRPGPACVLVRWNVTTTELELDDINPKLYTTDGHTNTSPPCISREDADRIANLLIEATAPVMIAGRGIHASRAYEEVQELAELLGMGVATSYMGKSSIAETHDLALGTMGNIGQRAANERIMAADVILAVGTGLSPENTRMLSPDYINPERQQIVQIDVEGLNAGWTFPLALGVTSDAKLALRAVIDAVKGKSIKADVQQRIDELKKVKEENDFFACDYFTSDEEPIAPERVVRDLNETVEPDDLVVLDAGNSRMWYAKHFRSKKAGQVVAPGGVAGLGWGPSAALGAQLISPDRRVVSVVGDGGLMMALYVLESAKQYELPLTYVVMNNSCLGNVMDFQAPDRRIITEYASPDFAAVAQAIGLKGLKIEKPDEIKPAVSAAMDSDRPAVIDVKISPEPHFRLMM